MESHELVNSTVHLAMQSHRGTFASVLGSCVHILSLVIIPASGLATGRAACLVSEHRRQGL